MTLSQSDANRSVYLTTLADAFTTTLRPKAMDDLNRSIAQGEEPPASCPNNHINRGNYLNNLGLAFQTHYDPTESMDDIDRAITTTENAVKPFSMIIPVRECTVPEQPGNCITATI